MSLFKLPYLEQKAAFMGNSSDFTVCDKVILGIPMDSTTSFRPGARLAPYRIREVSEGIEEYSIYQDKSLEDINFYDAGDIVIPFGNVKESLKRIENVTREILKQGKKVFALGGEHLVSLPLINAYHDFYPDLVVIQMDAHADLRSDYLGEDFSHATVMHKIAEKLGKKRVFQLGIRSGTKEEMEYAAENTCIYLNQLLSAAKDVKDKIGDKAVYITLDIDVLDPAFAPGTGTPEAGGFSSRELFETLAVFKGLNIVGFDLVEISPPYEQNDNTSLLGAKILREVLLAY